MIDTPAANARNLAEGRRLVHQLAQQLNAELIETHISWVLLAADTAYKIKKPLRLPFVDYSTLASRRFFCAEELRLNARLAASLYLGVSAITGTPQAPRLDGDGPVLEYAVRMRRFPAGVLFSELMQSGHLLPSDVDALAVLLAGFHQRAPQAGNASGYGAPTQRAALAFAALDGLAGALPAERWQALRDWMQHAAQALTPLWSARQARGCIRECHGDLHLANLLRLEGAVAAFDCVEFDPALRWIDVIDDLAFPVMDFSAAAGRAFAFRLLNGWLDATGDHDALPALRFSVVYRALVRALVAQLRGPSGASQLQVYLETAQSWMLTPPPSLSITHGLPGSGKTFQSQRLLEREGAIRLRSDVERKRLFGLGPLDDSRAAGLDLYNAGATARTYERLFELAAGVLASGYPVVIDAAFLRRDERDRAQALARQHGVPFGILACQAPPEILSARLRERRGDASEADESVLTRLQAAAESLTPHERQFCLPGSASE